MQVESWKVDSWVGIWNLQVETKAESWNASFTRVLEITNLGMKIERWKLTIEIGIWIESWQLKAGSWFESWKLKVDLKVESWLKDELQV